MGHGGPRHHGRDRDAPGPRRLRLGGGDRHRAAAASLAAGSAADVAAPGRSARRGAGASAADVIVMPSLTRCAPAPQRRGAGGRSSSTSRGSTSPRRPRWSARRIGSWLAAGDADGWLLGHGWSFARSARGPIATLLDEVAPGRPVALWSHDHHARWLSSAALELAGLAARHDPSGRPHRAGRRRRARRASSTRARPGSGRCRHPARPVPRGVAAAIGAYARRLAALGVTSVHDPGGAGARSGAATRAGPLPARWLRTARLPLRVTASVREEQLERAIELGFRSGRRGRRRGPIEPGRYRDGWLKLFSDGALGSRTASLLAPYETDDVAGPPPGGAARDGACGRAPAREPVTARAADAGIASQIHAIGDAAVRAALDVLATAATVKRGPPPDRARPARGPDGCAALRGARRRRLGAAVPSAQRCGGRPAAPGEHALR